MTSVLYLGCPASDRADTERILRAVNVTVTWSDSVPFVLGELKRKEAPVLLDLSRGAAQLQMAREIRSHRPSTLMFAIVDPRRPDLTAEAVLAGMADVFARPLGGRRVANAIQRELSYGSRQNPPAIDDLYGQSPAMREVVSLIARAATMRAGVLISGEEGTGRQTAGRAIHAAQNGDAGPFVVVNCALDGDHLETALFGAAARVDGRGEKKGGEVERGLERLSRTSRIYEVRHGTLYLQNVADASTRVQARLARLLRDREAVLADTGESIGVDVRPMAGVDSAFDHAVQEGRVRDDLVRRLAVIRIEVPPLRSRREDIPALANYFLREICAVQKVPPKTLSRPALALLSALPWRGNAIELRALLEAVAREVQGGKNVGLDDLLQHLKLDGGPVAVSSAGGTLKQARARFEREYIATVLEQHHGRVSDAARTLGIQRTNLYRKIRSLRIRKDARS